MPNQKTIIMIGLIHVGMQLVGVGRFTGRQRQFDVLSHSLKAILYGMQLRLKLWSSRPLPTPAAFSTVAKWRKPHEMDHSRARQS